MIIREQAVWETGLLDSDDIKEMGTEFAPESPVSDAEVGQFFNGPVQIKHLHGGHDGKAEWWTRARNDWFSRRITHAVRDSNDEHFGFDLFDRRGMRALDLPPSGYRWIEMSPGSSCVPHIDMEDRNARYADRKISHILLLSGPDEYGGGLIRVGGEALSAPDQRAAGTLIMFPSYCQWEIGQVTSGKLTLMVGWYEGPPWR